MALVQRIKLREVSWLLVGTVLALTAFGLAFVISACFEPGETFGIGRDAKMQVLWWFISLGMCVAVMHVPLTRWKAAAPAIYILCLLVQVFMMVAAGSALVPPTKGQCNWLALGPLRMQPSEFIKLGVLLTAARLLTSVGFSVARFPHVLMALAVASFPAALIAREDLGSALTFMPMIMGMLFVAGIRLRHLAMMGITGLLVVIIGIQLLPHEGPKSYQYQRIQAWLHPEAYALAEGYQTMRSIRSVGSGQLAGKGYAAGDQNRLGWLPANDTDLIFSVVSEETGFIGSCSALLLFLLFGWSGIYASTRCRDPFGHLVIVGFVCLVMGQVAINISVALGLMPVTGITLPFFSRGGSSMLGCYIGLGLALSAGMVAKRTTGTWRVS
jgi:cell division protein FtsW (lipid II flippase)